MNGHQSVHSLLAESELDRSIGMTYDSPTGGDTTWPSWSSSGIEQASGSDGLECFEHDNFFDLGCVHITLDYGNTLRTVATVTFANKVR